MPATSAMRAIETSSAARGRRPVESRAAPADDGRDRGRTTAEDTAGFQDTCGRICRTMRTLVFASVVTAALCASIATPAAQQKFEFVGPNQCLSCHDHDAERTWYE